MIILEFFIIIAIVITVCNVAIKETRRQRACKHDKGINETQACDAICRACYKNLGFIGTEENQARRRDNNSR